MKFTFFLAFHKSPAILGKVRCKNYQSYRFVYNFLSPPSCPRNYRRHNWEPHDVILYIPYPYRKTKKSRLVAYSPPPLPPSVYRFNKFATALRGTPRIKWEKRNNYSRAENWWPRDAQRTRQHKESGGGGGGFSRTDRRIRPLFRGSDKKPRYGTRVRYSGDPRTEGVPIRRGPSRIQWIIQPRHN